MLTREELQKAYTENYNVPQSQIDRMVDTQIEELYGSNEAYEQRLEKDKESRTSEFKPVFDETAFKVLNDEFDEEDSHIKNPDALDYYLNKKAAAVNAGVSEELAEVQSRHEAFVRFGEVVFHETENDPLDPEVNRLVERGIDLTSHEKRLIKSIMRTQGVTVLEAMKHVTLDKQRSNYKIEQDIRKAGGREEEYYDALSVSDRGTLESLKGGQPEANWTARKYYKMFNDKPLPRKPEPPKEETVPREHYETERKRQKELVEQMAKNEAELEELKSRFGIA